MIHCLSRDSRFLVPLYSVRHVRVLIFAISVLLIAGCVLLYAHCEQVYTTTTVVRFKESPSRKMLSIARDAATGLIRPKVHFYNNSNNRKASPSASSTRTTRTSTPTPVFTVGSQSRCTSAATTLQLPSPSTRRGSFLDIAGSHGGKKEEIKSPERSLTSDDSFDADSTHVTESEKPVAVVIPIPTSMTPLTPAYQSSQAIKISRMPFALFSYLQDDVLVLPPGFLNESSKF